jgi:hypothetical protein
MSTAASAALPNPMQRVLTRLGIDAPDFTDLAGPLGVTPKETIHASGTLKLHHYRPLAESVYRVPVLIVTSLANQGYDVCLIEWGRPRQEHKDLTLEDHVLRLLPECVDAVQRGGGQRQLSIIGYCIGRLLSVLYAALHENAPLENLVCMAAPVNGDGLVSLKAWMGEGFDVEGLIEQFGNVPADWVQNTLRALRPSGKLAGAANLLNQIDRDEVVRSNLRMGKWETDNIPFPGGQSRLNAGWPRCDRGRHRSGQARGRARRRCARRHRRAARAGGAGAAHGARGTPDALFDYQAQLHALIGWSAYLDLPRFTCPTLVMLMTDQNAAVLAALRAHIDRHTR